MTKFTLLAHPISQVWGGPRMYTADKAPQLLSAIANFTERYNETKSALLPTIAYPALLGSKPLWTVFFFWDGATPPSYLFAEFDAIKAQSDQTKVQTYPEILNMSAETALFTGRTADHVGAFPLIDHANMTEFLQWHYDQVSNNNDILHNVLGGFQLLSMAVQPIPVALQQNSFKGGPLGGPRGAFTVNPAGGDKIWIEYSLIWKSAAADQCFEQELSKLVIDAQDHFMATYGASKPLKYRSGDLPRVASNPIFANDAQAGQDVYRSLSPETFAKLQRISAAVDPTSMFQKQAPGFHLGFDSA